MNTTEDNKLCRYVPFTRFMEMLCFHRLTLVSPKKWNDQYENYLLQMLEHDEANSKIENILSSKGKYNPEQIEKIMTETKEICSMARCLCFSKSYDAEVMWNAYNYGNEAIMWTTTGKKLTELGRNVYKLELQKVNYDLDTEPERKRYKEFLGQISMSGKQVGFRDIFNFFTHKRECFSYENEYRLINIRAKDAEEETRSFNIPCLSDFITGVMVHPLADESYVSLIEKICKDYHLPFEGKSKIYEFDKIF